MLRRVLLILSIALLSVLAAYAGEGDGNKEAMPQIGSYQVSFTERHPLSLPDAVVKRRKWSGKDVDYAKEKNYDLSKESYRVYVPEDYDHKQPYGLFVWINSGSYGGSSGGWNAIFKKHKIIFIGANNSGNKRDVFSRYGLALDAVHNMTKRYRIDSRRIYISGSSGGGRCASMMAVVYPDVFNGGYYCIGCNYYKRIDLPNRHYRSGFWENFDPKIIEKAKKSRYVFMTGTKDMNQKGTKLHYEASLKDGFRRCAYFEVPGAGHQNPPADWFEKGIVFLDRYVKWMVPDGSQMLDGVELKNFESMKKKLVPGKPISMVMRSLERYAKKDDDKGKEAKAIIESVNNWTVKELKRLQDMKEKQPAFALESCETFVKTVKGMPCCEEAKALEDELKKDKNTVVLVDIREDIEKLHKKLDKSGPSKSTSKMKSKIEKKLEKLKGNNPSEALLEEINETGQML